MISFFQKSEKIRPFAAGIILAVLLLSSAAPSFIPEEAHASVPTHCTPLDVVCQLKEGLFSAGFGLDFLWREIASILIRSLTNSIIAWIQGDGGANVGFVGNFEDEFRRQVDGRAGQFLNQLAPINLCGNIGAMLQISLRTHPGFRDYFSCTLTDIVDNVEDFFNDFSNGGWEALIRVALVPKNNPYGAFLVALDKKIEVESAVENSVLRNVLSNIGFKGVQVEEKRCLDGPVETLPEGVNDAFVQENPDGTFQVCYIEHVTKTPGALVSDMLTRTVGSGYDFAQTADEINEAIDAIITALINELIGSTIDGIFNPSLANLPSGDSGTYGGLSITTISLPDGEQFISYSSQLQAVNGLTPYSWSVSSGALPLGLVLSDSGLISGIPQETNAYSFTVKLTDDLGATDYQPLSIVIAEGVPSAFTPGVGGCVTVSELSSGAEAPALDPAGTITLPEGIKDGGYCVHLALSPGVGETGGTWTTTVTEGSPPPGLTLFKAQEGATPPADQHPEISGLPTTEGEWNFTVTDILTIPQEEGSPVTTGWKQDYSITIAASAVIPPPPPPPPPPTGGCVTPGGKDPGASCQFNTECCNGSCFDPDGQTGPLIGTCSLPGGSQPSGGACSLDPFITTGQCATGLECVNNVCVAPSASASSAQSTSSKKPSVTSLAPSSGPIGTKIALTGTNFTDENKIYFGGYHAATIRKQNGTMGFNVPSVHCSAIPTPTQNCNIPSPNSGDYYVSVVNSNGTSNNLIFTVTGP